jgi:hypothetical protein
VQSPVATRANLSFNARLAVFAEITNDLRDYLHSGTRKPGGDVRDARKSAREIVRKFPALISGSSRQTLPIWFPTSSD